MIQVGTIRIIWPDRGLEEILGGVCRVGTIVIDGNEILNHWTFNSALEREEFKLRSAPIKYVAIQDDPKCVEANSEARKQPCLLNSEVFMLAKLVKQVENIVHYAPNIEGILDGTKMFLVQCRPMTVLTERGRDDDR